MATDKERHMKHGSAGKLGRSWWDPFFSEEPWVVALGEVVGNRESEQVELYRGDDLWQVPRELIAVRDRFVRPKTARYANSWIEDEYPGDSLQVLLDQKLLWCSPKRPYKKKQLPRMLSGIRLIPQPADSVRQDEPNDSWWIQLTGGDEKPVSDMGMAVLRGSVDYPNLHDVAETLAHHVGMPLAGIEWRVADVLLHLLDTEVAHLDLAT